MPRARAFWIAVPLTAAPFAPSPLRAESQRQRDCVLCAAPLAATKLLRRRSATTRLGAPRPDVRGSPAALSATTVSGWAEKGQCMAQTANVSGGGVQRAGMERWPVAGTSRATRSVVYKRCWTALARLHSVAALAGWPPWCNTADTVRTRTRRGGRARRFTRRPGSRCTRPADVVGRLPERKCPRRRARGGPLARAAPEHVGGRPWPRFAQPSGWLGATCHT